MRSKPWGLMVILACCAAANAVACLSIVETIMPLWFHCFGFSASLVTFSILLGFKPTQQMEPFTKADPWGEGRTHTFDSEGAPCTCAGCKGKPW